SNTLEWMPPRRTCRRPARSSGPPTMHRDLRITVVIPCYNEEHGLPRVLAKIPAAVDEILVLDNVSSDRTVDVALTDPRVRAVQHPVNLGYGGSYLRGLPMAGGDVLVTTDGDGTY